MVSMTCATSDIAWGQLQQMCDMCLVGVIYPNLIYTSIIHTCSYILLSYVSAGNHM